MNDSNLDRLIETQMFCDAITEECRFRKCKVCGGKQILIAEFDAEEECFYKNWISKTVIGTDKKEHRNTAKEKVFVKKIDLVLLFRNKIIPNYMKDKAVETHQKDELKSLKSNLTEKDIVVHVDFGTRSPNNSLRR